MLKKLNDTIRVEHVTAGQLRAGLRAKLACVADVAKLIFVGALEVARSLGAGSVKTWKALAFLCNTLAVVPAVIVCLLAESKFGLFWHLCVDHYLRNFISLFYLICCSREGHAKKWNLCFNLAFVRSLAVECRHISIVHWFGLIVQNHGRSSHEANCINYHHFICLKVVCFLFIIILIADSLK